MLYREALIAKNIIHENIVRVPIFRVQGMPRRQEIGQAVVVVAGGFHGLADPGF